jgi:hypothetical protein
MATRSNPNINVASIPTPPERPYETFDTNRTPYLPKFTAVRLADKVHPDPCGGGDLPEPGRSFDVV